ncbi:MAG: hypothetical protein LBT38_03350 [Deltaproteobacteria bacterium]|nr:hypothetical protein [Deltaproteobacteria bacterium]
MFGKIIFRRYLALIFLALALSLALTNPLSAQFNLANIPPERLAEEGPLTQKDIDFYLGFTQFFTETLEKNAANSEFDLDKAAHDYILAQNYQAPRFRYLWEKVMMLSLITIMGDEAFGADRPAYLNYTEAEKQLIKDNLNKIGPAIANLNSKLGN